MPSYTSFGQELWLWQPFLALTPITRLVWILLYTSPAAKRTPPGLWHGSIPLLSEAAHLPHMDTHAAVSELADHRMIERDDARRVIAMTMLPDRSERAPNGSCLKKWWNMFRAVPPCAVRDRWVSLLAWLCSPLTNDHQKVWPTTFGTVCPQAVDNSRQSALHFLQDSTACALPVDKQTTLVFSTIPDTVSDTVSDTPRDQVKGSGSGIRDQGEGCGEREAASPPAPRLLSVIQGGLVTPTQDHDEHGQPWGPEGPPLDRFFNGRRKNL